MENQKLINLGVIEMKNTLKELAFASLGVFIVVVSLIISWMWSFEKGIQNIRTEEKVLQLNSLEAYEKVYTKKRQRRVPGVQETR